ncbi:MAG TPA: hypothetical protein VGS19_01015 [Streptosporangiaceae bacterium]|nr:hypothetical protein [Streptosporangiaceae bacterium]
MHSGTMRRAGKGLWGTRRRRRIVGGATALTATVALGAAAAGMTGLSSAAVGGAMVMEAPAAGTPTLPKTKTTDFIRDIVQCGNTMYAVGTFTQIVWNGTTYPRNNVFSFSATSPFTVSSWNPNANGTVNTIALSSDCSQAYLGGTFTQAGGGAATNIADVNTTTGALNTGFAHDADKAVQTLALTNSGHLLAGGQFKSINGSTANPYFASLNPSTGADDGFLHLNIQGYYHWCSPTPPNQCNLNFPTQVANQQIDHHGDLDLAEGVFTTVGGVHRKQIFMLNLATNPATVTPWTSPEFDGSTTTTTANNPPFECWYTESYYMRDAAWSPDDSTIYTAETGNHPWNLPAGTFPRSGLCDAVAAWPATQGTVSHTWINYSGCDSMFSIAADDSAVYSAGHPRWADNGAGCNFQGTGGIPDKGLWGLVPASGALITNTNGNPRYSMSRANADTMLITSAGLWIGSSNRFGASWCDNINGHAGICFLPYKA